MPRDERHIENIPYGSLGIIPLKSCAALGEKVNNYLVEWRNRRSDSTNLNGYKKDSYIVPVETPRFGSGEAKAVINSSVRGNDLFIMVDVVNNSLTYKMGGFINHMSPDDHYADVKRVIAATSGKARRINVIMPFLYESRQHRKTARESLDCAYMLQELVAMGVDNIITFDAHDPRVQNSIPLNGFESVSCTYQFIKYLLLNISDLTIDSDHMMVISPDEGGMGRAVYFANILGLDMGMFYKRRDYSTVVNGKNPIVAHEFLGANIKGKTVIIIDDMISSGESMLDTAKELKDRGAKNVVVCCTFGLFTDGLEKFDDFNSQGYFDYVITTNLNYRSPELLKRSWYIEADMSKFTAAIINTLNHDVPIGNSLSPTEKIQTLLKKHKEQFE